MGHQDTRVRPRNWTPEDHSRVGFGRNVDWRKQSSYPNGRGRTSLRNCHRIIRRWVVLPHCIPPKELVCPPHLVEHKRRALILKATKYCITHDGLGWMSADKVILHFVNNKDEVDKLVKEFHVGLCGGHYAARTTAKTILRERYYWPTIFANTLNFVKACQPCQLFIGKQLLTIH